MSDTRRTVRVMEANTPPQPGTAEHWAAWLERYGDDYATHDERRAAYQDFQSNLATMQAVFSQPGQLHAAGYLAAHDRVAEGLWK
ncbi:Exonuclease SbcC [Mycolicibacterium hippocampi]|uniref:Exonuclease SbcC n=2 Tax=Mycobacteriaceae TaxID=1762 RepID=A0A850PT80_9MYCO|nr:Exonuclease SbcC [Mycolicibacterium hippocampi]